MTHNIAGPATVKVIKPIVPFKFALVLNNMAETEDRIKQIRAMLIR